MFGVSERTGVPLHAFYLTLHGKRLTLEALQGMERSFPVPLVMHGRLCGGSSVPGAWMSNKCHIGGCCRQNRVASDVEFLDRRTLKATLVLAILAGRSSIRARLPSLNLLRSTSRIGRLMSFLRKKGASVAPAAPSPAAQANSLDPSAVVAALWALGISDHLLAQIKASFPSLPAQKI